MRKLLHTLFLGSSVCVLFACNSFKEDFQAVQTQLTASLEGDADTKTTLSPVGDGISQVLWSEGDRIAVFLDGNSRAVPFELTKGAGTTKASFLGKGVADSYVAFYPESMVSSLSGETIRLTLPAEQTYSAGSFASGAFPMAAASQSSDLSFMNTASILRISLTGTHSVTRIVFRSKDKAAKVAGKATVSLQDPSEPVMKVMSDGCDSLILTASGVQLQESSPTDFYLVLPAQTYKGGFTVRVYTKSRYMDKEYTRDFTMERGKLHKADAFTFEPGGMEESEYLEGSGTESDPFLIQSLPDLILMRDAVNAGKKIGDVDAATAVYKLTDDIDLSPVCGGISKKSWTPIGTQSHPFMGVLNGESHDVKGLYINKNSNNQGFFGTVEQGGTISSLHVDGEIVANMNVGLIVGSIEGGTIDNCVSSGNVAGQYYCGGIVGYSLDSHVNYCFNHAYVVCDQHTGGIGGFIFGYGPYGCINDGTVSASSEGDVIGGIVGEKGGLSGNCINYGPVIAPNSRRVGGVFGLNQARDMYNCQNFGSVSGKEEVGGITGRSLQNGLIYNCLNAGSVSGEEYVAGICAYHSHEMSYANATTMMNCLNVGSVSGSGTYVGGICAFNEGADAGEGYPACIIEQNYWLYDPDRNLGSEKGVAVNEGKASGNFALTEAQLKGTAYSAPLYKTYTQVLDALNAWAFDHISSSSIRLQGWHYPQDGSYPALTGIDAAQPGEESSMFSISPTSFELKSSSACTIEVKVSASMDYSVSCPEWVEEGAVSFNVTDPYNKTHSFHVLVNPEESSRSGDIVFTNEKGKTLKAKVKQAGSYLTVEVEEVVLTDEGKAKRFSLYSTVSWTITSDAPWCTVAPASGTGDAMITVKASPNEAETARRAKLTVTSADGVFVHTLSVIQSGKKPDGGEEEPQGDWKVLPFVHQSVAMRFTATWCGWCPLMNRSIHLAQELYPDKIQHIALHDTSSDIPFTSIGPLENQFSISAFPTGVVDGRIKVSNDEMDVTARLIGKIVQETEDTYGTVSGVEITSSVAGSKVNVTANVYLKKAGDYKITVLLLEDGIMKAQSDYVEGDKPRYIHDDVARVAVTDVLGQAFSVAEAYTVKQFDLSATVPSAYEVDNMRVMVYIQRAFGSDKVIQTDASFGRYFIDNCATAAVGTHLKLALEGGSGGGGGGTGGSGDGNEGITPGGEIDM